MARGFAESPYDRGPRLKKRSPPPRSSGRRLRVDDGECGAESADGCGKTTLLRCINFLEDYDEGEIRGWTAPRYGTAPIRTADGAGCRTRRRAGCASRWGRLQQYNLFPHMTPLENLCLGPRFSQKVPAATP